MSEVRRPLEGIKVVELATFIAAPCTARFLADLGADVIKVEAPMGDPLRYTAANEGRPLDQKENTSYDLENAGKRCIALNIKSPEGREVLEKLIADADVFITNNRQPSLIKNKLDYDTLHAKYPALVYAFISGYGEKSILCKRRNPRTAERQDQHTDADSPGLRRPSGRHEPRSRNPGFSVQSKDDRRGRSGSSISFPQRCVGRFPHAPVQPVWRRQLQVPYGKMGKRQPAHNGLQDKRRAVAADRNASV